jgi:hypothetical protein
MRKEDSAMTSGTINLSRVFLKFWRKLTAASQPKRDLGAFIHDPAADRPHDLDDPFFDNKVQARFGKAIANATPKKRAKP